MPGLALRRSRNEREWREAWEIEDTDWRTAFDGLPRPVGVRLWDGARRRVADSCEVEHFKRR